MRPGAMMLAVAALALAGAAAPFAPTGARIEPSGFATIERAPSVPYPDAPPPPENQPRGEAEWYARDLGISVEEAAKRQREQQGLIHELNRLGELLPVKEAGNFAGSRMIHKPDWGYVYYFKRDPEATLARYTRHPRFRAALASYTQAELEALVRPWAQRFEAHRLVGGWGTDATTGTAEIMMAVTEDEYRAIAAREGWGEVPVPIKLAFSDSLPHPALEERAGPFVRVFAQDKRSTVIQLTAAASGRIVMRDGCLFVRGRREDGRDALAYFHRETGIGIDDEGYLAFKDRRTGKSRGRIGETFTWAGPNAFDEDMPMAAELRARCGNAPVINVGNPESSQAFRVRAWEVDEIARRRGVSRQRAWDMLKRCWTRSDDDSERGRRPHPCNL